MKTASTKNSRPIAFAQSRRPWPEFAEIDEMCDDASDLVRLIERDGCIAPETPSFDAE